MHLHFDEKRLWIFIIPVICHYSYLYNDDTEKTTFFQITLELLHFKAMLKITLTLMLSNSRKHVPENLSVNIIIKRNM